MTHIPEATLRRFAEGTASREENRRVVRHLLARCPACAASIRSCLRPPVSEESYDELIARAVRIVGT
jgi:hypothetical protein